MSSSESVGVAGVVVESSKDKDNDTEKSKDKKSKKAASDDDDDNGDDDDSSKKKSKKGKKRTRPENLDLLVGKLGNLEPRINSVRSDYNATKKRMLETLKKNRRKNITDPDTGLRCRLVKKPKKSAFKIEHFEKALKDNVVMSKASRKIVLRAAEENREADSQEVTVRLKVEKPKQKEAPAESSDDSDNDKEGNDDMEDTDGHRNKRHKK